MNINFNGDSLLLLDGSLYYSFSYPKRMAVIMWYCQDTFCHAISSMQKVYGVALIEENRLNYLRCHGAKEGDPDGKAED